MIAAVTVGGPFAVHVGAVGALGAAVAVALHEVRGERQGREDDDARPDRSHDRQHDLGAHALARDRRAEQGGGPDDDEGLGAGGQQVGQGDGLGGVGMGADEHADRARQRPGDDDDGVAGDAHRQHGARGRTADHGDGPDELEPAGGREEQPVGPVGVEVGTGHGEVDRRRAEREDGQPPRQVVAQRALGRRALGCRLGSVGQFGGQGSPLGRRPVRAGRDDSHATRQYARRRV